ncbi:MAG TPA: PIN domain-containing protein [Polyangiaceae bacterium]|jgi:predicted nucleic acid-binding protein
MGGLTLDTGALIGFERFGRRTLAHLKVARQMGCELTVPTAVVVEAWRGGTRSARIAALLEACVIEPLFWDLARIAGEAIATVKGATAVDAVVMASAARRGDRVLTSDFADLERLRAYFPAVRLLQI